MDHSSDNYFVLPPTSLIVEVQLKNDQYLRWPFILFRCRAALVSRKGGIVQHSGMVAFNQFNCYSAFGDFLQTIILINISQCDIGRSNKSNRARNSCGVNAKSKLRSRVCCISTAINESMPISESVAPNEIDFISRIAIMFITVSMIFSLPELPNRFSATTILATMASGALSNDEIRCCKVPPISKSILSSTILATKPTSPTAPHWMALAGKPLAQHTAISSSGAVNNLSAKTALNLISLRKQLIPSLVSFAMSNFPISRKFPLNPKQRTEANNLSSDSEFKTKSTPLPLVSRIIIRSNEVSREFPIVGKTDSSMNSYTSGGEGRSISVIRPVTTKAPDSVICGGKSELLAYVWKTKSNVLTYFKIASTILRSHRPSAKAEISDFISVKLILGAIFPVSNAKQALIREQMPEVGSAWPTFDLTEPTNRGVER
uniref:Uncharacterized protein n=1 Tax=Glossina pallidipes TaxID=7398 RepID=A0A1B0AA79_GLOPL